MSASPAKVLYRNILKAHKKHLPADLRDFGDMYVRNEFNLHKKVTSSDRLGQFYVSWEGYLRQLRPQEGDRFGKDLSQKEKVNLNKEQQEKLDELLKESRNPTPPESM